MPASAVCPWCARCSSSIPATPAQDSFNELPALLGGRAFCFLSPGPDSFNELPALLGGRAFCFLSPGQDSFNELPALLGGRAFCFLSPLPTGGGRCARNAAAMGEQLLNRHHLR